MCRWLFGPVYSSSVVMPCARFNSFMAYTFQLKSDTSLPTGLKSSTGMHFLYGYINIDVLQILAVLKH